MLVTAPPAEGEIIYPEYDGKPMAESTLQLAWIIKLVGNLEALFADRADVFVGGNQNWYPVKGEPEIVQAPDAYVVFGRPRGHRASWKQWKENDVPITVAFEVRSPSNTETEMIGKHLWYEQYGVEEYYDFDPEARRLDVYARGEAALAPRYPAHGFVSPRLGIRFDLSGPEMVVHYPDGRPFLPVEKFRDALRQEEKLRIAAQQQAEAADKRADDQQKRAVRLAELMQKTLLQQATTEEQEELRALMAGLLKS